MENEIMMDVYKIIFLVAALGIFCFLAGLVAGWFQWGAPLEKIKKLAMLRKFKEE